MDGRFALPTRLGSGLKFLMIVTVGVYILLLGTSAFGPHGFDYGLATAYPIVAAMFFTLISWINSRGGIQWSSDTIYEVSLLGSFFPNFTRSVPMGSVCTVSGEIKHSGAIPKHLFVPFDTIILEVEAEKPLLIQADFVDQEVLKHLLGDIHRHGRAAFAEEIVDYMSSGQQVF